MKEKKIIVFGSGNGSNFQAIVEYFRSKRLPVEVLFLFCENPKAKIIERAKMLDVKVIVEDFKKFKSRKDFDRKVEEILDKHSFDLLVLAGYMKILPEEIIKKYKYMIINIHPSLLPAFPGLRAIEKAYNYGVKYTGITIHYVDEGVDTGPIIEQIALRIRNGESLKELEERIHRIEHYFYPRIIEKLLFEED
ncbi:MAG: phosphoribosylglycinamide formyltransferase 1 [Thermotogaceae bacterium]|nr:phosphoribosylglycinamide formyltransferase 1 [Thermotogaceae bacterium]